MKDAIYQKYYDRYAHMDKYRLIAEQKKLTDRSMTRKAVLASLIAERVDEEARVEAQKTRKIALTALFLSAIATICSVISICKP